MCTHTLPSEHMWTQTHTKTDTRHMRHHSVSQLQMKFSPTILASRAEISLCLLPPHPPTYSGSSLNHTLFFPTSPHTLYFPFHSKHMLTRNRHTRTLRALICVFVSVVKYSLTLAFACKLTLCCPVGFASHPDDNSCSQVFAFPLLHCCAFPASYYSTSPACIAWNLAQETEEVGSDLEKWGQ